MSDLVLVKKERFESTRKNGYYQVSAFIGELTQDFTMVQLSRIKAIFPEITKEYMIVLMDFLKENNFTDKRLKFAVDNILINCEFKPKPADFIKYDKYFNVLTYSDMLKQLETDKKIFLKSKCVRLSKMQSQPLWVLQNVAETYNLEEYKKQE
jgi:hypothetical protein